MRFPYKSIVIVFLTLSFTLAACSNPSATPTLDAATPTQSATPTSTSEPQRLVYVSSAPVDTDINAPILTQFAADNNLLFEQTPALASAALGSSARIVVMNAEPADLSSILDANPSVQFILLGPTSISGRPNLSTLASNPADVYFMAGYLTTLIAYDWRSAALLVGEASSGNGAADAFLNGGRYVCGKCNPSYPPLVDLPQVASLPASSSSADWLAQANALLANGVNAIYLDPAAASPEVVASMVNTQTVIIGTGAPVADSDGWWGASITSDASAVLGDVLARALNGEGGRQVTVPITLTNIDANRVSPARQDLFNQTAQLLAEGKLGASSIP